MESIPHNIEATDKTATSQPKGREFWCPVIYLMEHLHGYTKKHWSKNMYKDN